MDEKAANITIYIALDETTFGGTPRLNNSGLYIELPESPRAPEAHPPKNEKHISLNRVFPCSKTSPLAREF